MKINKSKHHLIKKATKFPRS